jgi:hypothetical protein
MKIIIALLLAFCCLAFIGCADTQQPNQADETISSVHKLPVADQEVLHDVSRFHAISTATNLPPAIFKLCAGQDGWLAEPGERWNTTDIVDPNLPSRQFVWAETDGYYYVVHYETGGIGEGFHFLVVKLKNGKNKPDFVWHGVGVSAKDYAAFIEALKTGKIDDSLPYIY